MPNPSELARQEEWEEYTDSERSLALELAQYKAEVTRLQAAIEKHRGEPGRLTWRVTDKELWEAAGLD